MTKGKWTIVLNSVKFGYSLNKEITNSESDSPLENIKFSLKDGLNYILKIQLIKKVESLWMKWIQIFGEKPFGTSLMISIQNLDAFSRLLSWTWTLGSGQLFDHFMAEYRPRHFTLNLNQISFITLKRCIWPIWQSGFGGE